MRQLMKAAFIGAGFVGSVLFISCARMTPPALDGRFAVESVFSSNKAWMEFSGDTFWYLSGSPADGAAEFSFSKGKLQLSEFGGHEDVSFDLRSGKDGELLLFLDTESPGGRELLESIAGGDRDEAARASKTAFEFNAALRESIQVLFTKYPFMRLRRQPGA